MTKKRKKYTQEFRESAVKLITEQGYKNAEAARNLGINPTMLGRWKREIEGCVVGNSDPINTKVTWSLVGDTEDYDSCDFFEETGWIARLAPSGRNCCGAICAASISAG